MNHGKMDWLKLEAAIRAALREYAPYHRDGADDPASRALQKISDAIGDETGRGYIL